MSEFHQIGELLRAGVKPSKEEVEHLADLGAFVSAMYGRYLHGGRPADAMGANADGFASELGGRLGAATSTRWELGMGLTDQFLSPEWSGWWQVGRSGVSAGYDWPDFERAVVDLYEDEAPAIAAESTRAADVRRGSLFGRRASSAGRTVQATRRQPAQATSTGVRRVATGLAQWQDGALVELATLAALERGGLFIGDQIGAATAPASLKGGMVSATGSVAGDAAQVAGVASSASRRAPIGGRTASNSRGRSTRAVLDGVIIDERTPALASALRFAEAAFGTTAGSARLAVNPGRLAEMTAVDASKVGRGPGGAGRPVFAFYDSVDGHFVALTAEDGPAAVASAAAVEQRASARSSVVAGSTAVAQRSVGQASAARRAAAAASPVVASLDMIAAPASDAANRVRAYTRGIFRSAGAPAALVATPSTPASDFEATPRTGESRRVVRPEPGTRSDARYADFSPGAGLATGVTYTVGGFPQVRVERSSIGVPRVALASLSALARMAPSRPTAAAVEPGHTSSAAPEAFGRPVGDTARATAFETQWAGVQSAATVSGGVSGIGQDWRMVSDLGPDVPLGATLGRSEIFGASSLGYMGPQTVLGRTAFVPGIAREHGVGLVQEGFGSRAFTDATDGVVWVVPESNEMPTAVEAASGRMPLSVVPRGRAATMVPASQALELGVRSAVHAHAASAATMRAAGSTDAAQNARIESRVMAELRSGMIAARGNLLVAGTTGQGEAARGVGQRGFAGNAAVGDGAMLRRGTSVRPGQPVGGVEASAILGQDRPGLHAAAASRPVGETASVLGDAAARDVRTAGGMDTNGVRENSAAGSVLGRGVTVDAEGVSNARLTQGMGMKATAVPGVARETAAQQALIGQATAGDSVRATAVVDRLSQWIGGLLHAVESRAPLGVKALGAGAYARFDAPREIVNLVDDVLGQATTAQGDTAQAPQRRAGVAAQVPGRTTRMSGAATAASTVTWQQVERRDGASASIVERGGRRAAQLVAGTARTALRRPVATAREAREVAPLLQALARVSTLARLDSGSMEPVLARGVLNRAARIDELSLMRGDAATTQSTLHEIGGLPRTEAHGVMQTLRAGGWTGSELEMLSLTDEGAVDAATAAGAPATRRDAVARLREIARAVRAAKSASILEQERTAGGQVGGGTRPVAGQMVSSAGEAVRLAAVPTGADAAAERGLALGGVGRGATSVAGGPLPVEDGAGSALGDAATAARLGRNLARVISGTEALGASSGLMTPAVVTSGQSAAFLPLLAQARPDGYFGETAPDRRKTFRMGDLRDAVGELVAIAAEAAGSSDTAVGSAGKTEMLRRLVATQSRLAERQPAAREALARVMAAGSDPHALSRALAEVPMNQRAEAMALARVNAPLTVARLEREATDGGDRTLAEVLFGRQLPVKFDAARIGSVADAPRPTLAAMLGVTESELLAPEAAERTEGAAETAPGKALRHGVGSRVNAALSDSARGPAGARRLLEPLRQPLAQGDAESRSGRTIARFLGHRSARRHDAVVPMDLASVIAPEAMLSGLRSVEASDAVKALSGGQTYRGEAPGVFATLADSGFDMSSPTATVLGAVGGRESRAVPSRGRGLEVSGAGQRAAAPEGRTGEGPMGRRRLALGTSDPVQVLLQLVGRDPGAAERVLAGGGDSGTMRRGRAGLLSAMMRGADRREVASLFQQAGASDFAFAWLNRVDGTRSGLDLGLGGTRTEMGRAFGQPRQVTSRVAGESPIQGADFVGPATSQREDRSGLRSLASHVGSSRTGSGRPQHGASAALRRTDWRFVETGSRTQTPHADLGKLAAAIANNSQAAARAPLPLIAPAAKAVAQTALLSSRATAAPAAQSKSRPKSAGGAQSQQKATLSEEAMEQLAIEMASRVAQIMGRNKERIGVWQ